jgi:hypothetical protein
MQGVENLENRKEEGEKIPKQIVKTIKIWKSYSWYMCPY